jgi:16S rRNA G1207 methylase RsmC
MELSDLKIPSTERLLIAAQAEIRAEPRTILCTTLGRAQTAVACEEWFPEAHIRCQFLDLYPAEETRELLAGQGSRIDIVCTADLPEEEVDLVVLPFTRGGDGELTRDLLQQGFDRLRVGGVLFTAVDNFKDVWLHHEIEKLQKGVTRIPSRWGIVYRLAKKAPLKKLRDYSREFAFRDGERLVKLKSWPGTFSHRELDLGARALTECMTIEAGDRVVDFGCGSGAVGLAAALRAPDVVIHAVDSNMRAIRSVEAGAVLNGLESRVTTRLAADGSVNEPGTYDVFLGNPPYYSHYAIAELFLQAAKRSLKPGGRVSLVAKKTEWLIARMKQLFDDVAEQSARGYAVVSARRK